MNDATSSNVKQSGEQGSAERGTASAASPESEPTGTLPQSTRPWWQSRTLQGVAITVLSLTASDWLAADEISRAVEAIGTLAGTILTVYGRIKADRPLSIKSTDSAVLLVASALLLGGCAGASLEGAARLNEEGRFEGGELSFRIPLSRPSEPDHKAVRPPSR